MEQYIQEILQLLLKMEVLDSSQIDSIHSLNSLNPLQSLSYNYNLMMLISCIALGFGILNMVFGYRLLRFWMMLFGFLVGAVTGFLFAYISGVDNNQTMIAIMIGAGVFLAIFSFLIYKAGIFIVGAGIGLSIGVYIIHPRTSLTFFLCILLGVGVGMLALKFSKGIIIVGTSILGGVTTGFAASWLADLDEFPYGVGMSILFTLMAIAIQYAFNRSSDEELEEKEEKREAKRQKKENQRRRREREKVKGYDSYDTYEDDEYYDEGESIEDNFREEDLERLKHRRSAANQQIYYDLNEGGRQNRAAKSSVKDEIELYPVQRKK